MGESRAFVTYHPPVLDNDYLSDPTRNTTSLDGTAYVLTDAFLNIVFRGHMLPQEILETFDLQNVNVFIDTLLEEWQTVFTYNWRICFCIVFGFLMTLLVPIGGIIYCCMHCRGKCGARGRPSRSQSWGSSVKRQTAITFFLVFWCFSLWGMIWHFTATSYMGDGVRSLPRDIDYVVTDMQRFINNTVKETYHLKTVNYDLDLRNGFGMGMDELAGHMEDLQTDQLYSRSCKIDYLVDVPVLAQEIVLKFENQNQSDIVEKLEYLREEIKPVDTAVSDLLDANEWTYILANCDPYCDVINELLNNVEVDKKYISDPELIRNIQYDQADKDALERFIPVGQYYGEQIEPLGEDFVNTNRELFVEILDELDDFIVSETSELTEVIENMIFEMPNVDENVEDIFETWFNVAFYSFLIPSILLMIILVVYLIGFMVGFFARTGSPAKKKAATTLYAGNVSYLSLAFIFWLMTTLLFVSGGMLQELGCQTLEDPEESDLYVMFEEDINEALRRALNNSKFDNITWNLPQLLYECEDGKGLYELLHLDEVYKMDLLKEWRDHVDTSLLSESVQAAFNETILDVASKYVIIDPTLPEALEPANTKSDPIYFDYVMVFFDEDVSSVIDIENLVQLEDSLVQLQTNTSDQALKTDLDVVIQKNRNLLDAIEVFNGPYTEVSEFTMIYMEEVEYHKKWIFKHVDSYFQEGHYGYIDDSDTCILEVAMPFFTEELDEDMDGLITIMD